MNVAPQLALQVADLHKQFGSVSVLKGVYLDACVGDVISMLGASGSGKSTFLRCINLLEIPDAGTVTVHGETIRMTRDKLGIHLRKTCSRSFGCGRNSEWCFRVSTFGHI